MAVPLGLGAGWRGGVHNKGQGHIHRWLGYGGNTNGVQREAVSRSMHLLCGSSALGK